MYAPPLPIPNRVVKLYEPNDTICFGGGESRVRRYAKIVVFFYFFKFNYQKSNDLLRYLRRELSRQIARNRAIFCIVHCNHGRGEMM